MWQRPVARHLPPRAAAGPADFQQRRSKLGSPLTVGRWRATMSLWPLGSAQPDLPPITDFAARTPTHAKAPIGASAGRAFQAYRVVELPFFSRPVDNYLVDPPLHPVPPAAGQAHVR